MPPGPITPILLKIKHGTLDTTNLSLIKYSKKDSVVWRIVSKKDIDSFEIITKSGIEVFVTPPHKDGDDWTAVVDQNAADYAVYSYAIKYWKAGESQTWDPLIAINPTSSPINVVILVSIIVAIIVGGVSYWRGFNYGKRVQARNGGRP